MLILCILRLNCEELSRYKTERHIINSLVKEPLYHDYIKHVTVSYINKDAQMLILCIVRLNCDELSKYKTESDI
jgi:hypothetical protein